MNARKLGALGRNVWQGAVVVAVTGILMGVDCGGTSFPPGNGTIVTCTCVCSFTCSLEVDACAVDSSSTATHDACLTKCGEMACNLGGIAGVGDSMPCDPLNFPAEQGNPCGFNSGNFSDVDSIATVSYIDSSPIQMHVAGDFAFTGGCEIGTCPIEFSRMNLVPDNFSIPTPVGDFDVTDAFIVNNSNLIGTQSGRSFTIPSANVQMLVNGYVNGIQQSLVFTPTPGEDLFGIHVPSTAEFGLFGHFTELDGDLTLTLNLNGTMTARPPVAHAGASQTVSCNPLTGTGTALLDGSASSDIDGNLDTVAWYDGDTSLGTGITLSAEFVVGTHTVTGYAIDTTGKFNSADTTVTVLYDAPPVFDAPSSITVPTCTPGLVMLSTPDVIDLCSAVAPIVAGQIIEINGVLLATPIPVDTMTGAIALPSGTATVLWTATTDGGIATMEQTIVISGSADITCCAPSQVLYEGTPGADNQIDPNATTGYCMFGFDGKDQLRSGVFTDFISGGPGDDKLVSHGGDDVIVGDAGDDDITYQGTGTIAIRGGDGNDKIHLAFGPTATIFGGAGDDQVTCDGGNDTIYPGPGEDDIRAGGGDDTVIFYHPCELAFKKKLNGGAGNDTLVIPVPLASLTGIHVVGFENIVVDSSQQHLAECP